jgi:hypothetical protein
MQLNYVSYFLRKIYGNKTIMNFECMCWVHDTMNICVYNFQVRHPRCVDMITSIDKMQSNTTISNLHVCTVHQQYQSTFYCSTMIHTIIKSQEY